ncbi:MAG TPA: hypothetical protein VMJ32_16700 [Pirellulales bacterium]|nr:hypothetical protein [Pirellulales bacterium]
MNFEIQPAARQPRRPIRASFALTALGLLMTLFAAGGASCNQWVRGYTQPRMLPATATIDQIITLVNDNANRVQSLQSTQATLSLPGAPSLRATVALAPPRRLRLRASSLTGAELDLGSNDDLFWLWVARNQPPATFVCRHDQFAMSNARQILPVEPEWLIDAAGLARFDTTQPLEGPFPVHGDRVEIRSHRAMPTGEVTQITVVDQWEGAIVEQDVYNPQGQLLAVARASGFQRDAASGANLPHSIDVQWPTTQLSFHLDISGWVVNGIPPDNLTLWTKPEYPGFPNVDLADPHLQFAVPGGIQPVTPVTVPGSAGIYPPGATVPLR